MLPVFRLAHHNIRGIACETIPFLGFGSAWLLTVAPDFSGHFDPAELIPCYSQHATLLERFIP